MSKIRILLDPGHGAGKAHNRGFRGGDNEGDVNFNFCFGHLKPALEEAGFYVRMTRNKITDNPDLDVRGEMAEGYDLFISVHSNSMSVAKRGTASGTEIWDDVTKPNKKLATALCKAISNTIGIPNRGVKYKRDSDGDDWYGVLRANKAKAGMLVENFFHDNDKDVRRWWMTYKQVAKTYAKVLTDYYGIQKEVEQKEEAADYTQKEFIEAIADLVVENYSYSRILPSIAIAQACIESAFGSSELAKNARNYFGIKASKPWAGTVYEKKTSEFVNGKYIEVVARFRKYNSMKESVLDHGAFFRSTQTREELYKNVYTASDYKTAAMALQGTYATDPTYGQKLIQFIEKHNLQTYDKITGAQNKPIGVFAKSSADDGTARRIVSLVKDAVLIDYTHANPTYFRKIVQVGGGVMEKIATEQIFGKDRYETDAKVTEWINKNK